MARLHILMGLATAVVTAAMVLATRLPGQLWLLGWLLIIGLLAILLHLSVRSARSRCDTGRPPVLSPEIDWRITVLTLSLWGLCGVVGSAFGKDVEIIVMMFGGAVIFMGVLSSAMKRSR